MDVDDLNTFFETEELNGKEGVSESINSNTEQSLLLLLGIDNFDKNEENQAIYTKENDTVVDFDELFAPFNMELNDMCSDYNQSIPKVPKYNKINNVSITKTNSNNNSIKSSLTREYDNNNNLKTTLNNNDIENTFHTHPQIIQNDLKKDFKPSLHSKTPQTSTDHSHTNLQQHKVLPHHTLPQQNNTLQVTTTSQQNNVAPQHNSPQQMEKCVGCMKPITERYLLKVMEQSWHEDCLKCSCCNCRLGEVGSTLFTRANLMLCKRDYLRLFGASGYCSSCSKAIPAFEMVMKARGHVYHLDCFSCYYCSHRFCVGDRYYLHDNKILCEVDYEEKVSNSRLNPNKNNNSLLMTSPSLPFPSVSPTYINNNTSNNNTSSSSSIVNLKSKSYLNSFHQHPQQQYNQLISPQPFQLHQQQQQQYLQQQQQQHAINNNFINGLNSRS